MDDRRVGLVVREVRIRKRWRQQDLAARAGLSRSVVSSIERGRLEDVALAKLRKVGEVLDIRISIDAWWRSGNADRLLDRGHAAIVDQVVRFLRDAGWVTRIEVTFNEFGDRGSADVVGWHPLARVLVIVEVKTRIDDVQETHATMDRKIRVLPRILEKQEGWVAVSVFRLLVVADTRGNRAVVSRHEASFTSVMPSTTRAVQRWLQSPAAQPIQDVGEDTPIDPSQPFPSQAPSEPFPSQPFPSQAPSKPFGGIWFIAPDRLPGGVVTSEGVRVRRRSPSTGAT